VREKDINMLGDNKSTFSKIRVNDLMLLNSNRTMHLFKKYVCISMACYEQYLHPYDWRAINHGVLTMTDIGH